MSTTTQDQQYFNAFKTVRNRLRKFPQEALIDRCLHALRIINPQDLKKLASMPPWTLLLLLKWTWLYGQPSASRPLNEKDFLDLVQRTKDLDPESGLPDPDLPLITYIRGVLYQQSWLQRMANKPDIARQNALFRGLTKKRHLREVEEVLGIPVLHHLDLCIATASAFMDPSVHSIPESYFAPLEEKYSAQNLSTFIEVLAPRREDVRGQLRLQCHHTCMEYRERSPFQSMPLVRYNNRIHVIYKPVLFDTLANSVYRRMRQSDPNQFMGWFGSVFENYVRAGLESYNTPFDSESSLKAKLGGSGKVADFFLQEPDGNIFIDAKGVELSLPGMVAQDPSFVSSRVDDSVLKGVLQASDTALRMRDAAEYTDRRELTNYAIIVTYEDLFLGNGEPFAQSIAHHSSQYQEAIRSKTIRADNIYCMSVREFDALVGCALHYKASISSILDYVTETDNSPDKRLQIAQHLVSRFGQIAWPPHVEQAFESAFASVLDGLPDRHSLT